MANHYGKYVKQLEILSNLRNLLNEVVLKIEAMPIHYNLETDVRYQQGTAKGIEKGIEIGAEKAKRLFVENLLRQTDFSDEKIAHIANVTVELVEEIRRELEAQ